MRWPWAQQWPPFITIASFKVVCAYVKFCKRQVDLSLTHVTPKPLSTRSLLLPHTEARRSHDFSIFLPFSFNIPQDFFHTGGNPMWPLLSILTCSIVIYQECGTSPRCRLHCYHHDVEKPVVHPATRPQYTS